MADSVRACTPERPRPLNQTAPTSNAAAHPPEANNLSFVQRVRRKLFSPKQLGHGVQQLQDDGRVGHDSTQAKTAADYNSYPDPAYASAVQARFESIGGLDQG